MKRKKLLYGVAIMVLTMGMLTACGDGSERKDQTVSALEGEPLGGAEELVLSEEESVIRDYELRYSSGDFAVEDYHTLAELYREQGMIRRQRDLLEQSYRLYDDMEAFGALQKIYVNLAEETFAVQEEAALMLQNLEIGEYLDESVNLISSEEWIETMMPKLYEGSRNYFMQRDGKTVLTIQVGYDQAGTPDTKVWYQNTENKVTFLRRTGDIVQMLSAAMAEGNYDGGFEAWFCDADTGDIYHEQGTFAKDVLTGEYTVSVHEGAEASEIYSLWSNREGMEYSVYQGQFDAQGVTMLEQPTEKQIKSLVKDSGSETCVVYAYDNNKEIALFQGLTGGVEPKGYSFRAEEMGWVSYPAFETYEVKASELQEDTSSEESEDDAGNIPQVRIFDGEIQIYIGNIWVGVGNVEQYAKEDPFRMYAENRNENTNGIGTDTDGQEGGTQNGDNGTALDTDGQNMNGSRRFSGKIAKEQPATPKPSTPKPSTPKPEPPAEPQQPSQPTPQPPAEPQQPSQPTPQPPAEPQQPSQPTPQPPAEPSTPPDNSGDVDIEWTDDIL